MRARPFIELPLPPPAGWGRERAHAHPRCIARAPTRALTYAQHGHSGGDDYRSQLYTLSTHAHTHAHIQARRGRTHAQTRVIIYRTSSAVASCPVAGALLLTYAVAVVSPSPPVAFFRSQPSRTHDTSYIILLQSPRAGNLSVLSHRPPGALRTFILFIFLSPGFYFFSSTFSSFRRADRTHHALDSHRPIITSHIYTL